jgi:hypothetical protein
MEDLIILFWFIPYNGILNLGRKIILMQHLVPGRIFKKRALHVNLVAAVQILIPAYFIWKSTLMKK